MNHFKTIHLIIIGKVQGVYFRASCVEIAQNLDLKGWVRNLPDNRVEIMASGSDIQIEDFIEWCRKGPPGARVDECIAEEKTFQQFENFTLRR